MILSLEDTKRLWKEAEAVCFDVDSTVCTDEAVDELAKAFDVGDAVKEWTKKAMNGSVTFQEAINARMKIINPTIDKLQEFLISHKPSITPGARELVNELHNRGCKVYLISGGVKSIIEPVAKELGVKKENIFANQMLFNWKGEFVQMDENQPTCRTGGKAEAVHIIKKLIKHKTVVMVGDGATDLEACPPADAMIGFGGNIVRDVVMEKSNWFVHSFEELMNDSL